MSSKVVKTVGTVWLLLLLSPFSLLGEKKPSNEHSPEVIHFLKRLDHLPERAFERRAELYGHLGRVLLKDGLYQEAITYGLRALGETGYDPSITLVLGEAFYRLGRYQEALERFQRYAVLSPSGEHIGRVYYLMGELYIRLGAYERADIALSTATHYKPFAADWWSRLGYAQERGGRRTQAEISYKRALKLRPALITARKGLERIARN